MRIIYVTILVLAVGAASYWYAYHYEAHRLVPVAEIGTTATAITLSPPVSTPTANPQPYREYTVAPGDTLYSISKQYGLLWSTVAEYNQLAENAVIKPGSTIKIPLNEKGEITRVDHLPQPSDADKERITQELKQGISPYYADPIQVVRKTAPSDYHFKNDDSYTLLNLDYTTATAMIEVVHDGRTVVVSLAQCTPGKGNGWYITQLETR